MNNVRKRINWTTIGLVALVIGLAGYQTHARRNMMMQPSVIGTVDLVRAFNSLTERSAMEAELTAEVQILEDTNQKLKEEIKLKSEDLEDFARGSDNFNQLSDEILQASFMYDAATSYKEQLQERRLAEITLQLYQNIRDAAKRLSESRAIDIVFVDDTKVAIEQGSYADVTRQISARRMLYVNPMIDITDDIIEMMNNEYSQGPRNRSGN